MTFDFNNPETVKAAVTLAPFVGVVMCIEWVAGLVRKLDSGRRG